MTFLGQVKDRLLYCIGDIRERSVPAVTEWLLKACDLNKDIEIDDKAQLTLPDLQLKYAGRVFRQYVKCLHDKAVYRSEESLTLNHLLLKEALDNIRYPHKPIVANIYCINCNNIWLCTDHWRHHRDIGHTANVQK